MAWTQNGNIRGASGVPGASGASGPQGASGVPGATGPTGASGASGGTGGTGGPGTTTWADITDKPGAILNYKGTWNASTNSPSLSDGTGSGGDVYRVSVAGSRNLGSGTISWEVGDYAIWSPVTSSWEKADTTDAVSSVAGRTGAVTLTSADLGASGSASSSTFLRGDNTWATPTGITRSISTVTSNTTVGSAANTDYVVFANISSGDTLYSNTVAILHGDGTNNSTTITDNSALAANWTASGNAKLVTATKKFGTAAISFDGTSNTYIYPSAASSNFAFGTGPFTIEFHFQFTTAQASYLFDFRSADGTAPAMYSGGGTSITYRINSSDVAGIGSLSTGVWYHVAICRSGTSTRAFLNGTQFGSTYSDSTNYTCASGKPFFGMDFNNSFRFAGLMDDIRITRAARYTANFTAPSAAFPDVAGTVATVTLPTAASNTNHYTVKNIHSTDTLTLATTSSQTIDGSAPGTLATGAITRVVSDGSNWRTV